MSDAERPNVVVLVLDSVRLDRTSVGGYGRETTPNLRDIAEGAGGRSFGAAIAHTRYTLPSSASILTGRYPGDHGVGFGSNELDATVPTVAEAFREAGYSTAMVSSNHFVSAETGLDRGFDRSQLLPNSPADLLRTVGVGPLAKWTANIRRHSAGLEPDKYRHSSAYLTTALVERQLDSLSERSDPFFLYAHYNQPHRPYYPPLAWFDRYDAYEMSRGEAGDFSMDVHNNLEEYVAKGCPFTDDQWATLNALYDAQLEYTDTFVGRLFERIRRGLDDTVVVVTSDHGEHFGERGALGHKYALDDALLRVPLVTSGLRVPPTDEPVQHSDLMKTLLAEAGAETGFVDGVDLRRESREFAVSQDGPRSLDRIYGTNPRFDASQFFPGADRSLPKRTAVRTAEYRYVRGDDGTRALFALPDESRDVSGHREDVVVDLDATLDDWQADRRAISPARERDRGGDLSEGARANLRKMGYLEEDL